MSRVLNGLRRRGVVGAEHGWWLCCDQANVVSRQLWQARTSNGTLLMCLLIDNLCSLVINSFAGASD